MTLALAQLVLYTLHESNHTDISFFRSLVMIGIAEFFRHSVLAFCYKLWSTHFTKEEVIEVDQLEETNNGGH